MILGLTILAGSQPVQFDITALVQYGVLGVILILVLLGYLWAKPSVDRLIKDKERAEEQRDALLDTYQTKVIPVLTEVQLNMIPGLAKVADSLVEVQRTADQILAEVRRTKG